jgi:hypothetical protein
VELSEASALGGFSAAAWAFPAAGRASFAAARRRSAAASLAAFLARKRAKLSDSSCCPPFAHCKLSSFHLRLFVHLALPRRFAVFALPGFSPQLRPPSRSRANFPASVLKRRRARRARRKTTALQVRAADAGLVLRPRLLDHQQGLPAFEVLCGPVGVCGSFLRAKTLVYFLRLHAGHGGGLSFV